MHEMALLLIRLGAGAGIVAGYYGSLMCFEGLSGNTRILRQMLKKSSTNIHNPPCGDPLQHASYFGTPIVDLLLQAGTNINSQQGQFGNAIRAAATGENASSVLALPGKEADPNSPGQFLGNGRTGPNIPYWERRVELRGGFGLQEKWRVTPGIGKELLAIWGEPFPEIGFYSPTIKSALRVVSTVHNKILLLFENEPTPSG